MRRLTQKMWDLLFSSDSQSAARRRPSGRRLTLESLEERATPTATASGTITGVAFIDTNHNGVYTPGEYLLPGVRVDLTGTTSQQGVAVNVTAVTNAQGAFTFDYVQPGTYKIGFVDNSLLVGEKMASPALSGPPGVTEDAQVTIKGGQTATENVAIAGLSASAVSLGQFSNSGTILNILPAGSGVAYASSRANNAPTVIKTADLTVTGAESGSSVKDLAGVFTDPDLTDSEVQINTNMGSIDVELYNTTAPQTVANFLSYVENGSYNNTIFHRLVSDFVIQAGGFTLSGGSTPVITPITTLPDVPNEYGAANTAGTIAMAKLGSNSNSASSQFFFNLADNSSNLDTQNGGFTVFGEIVGQTSTTTVSNPTITKLEASTITDESDGNSSSPFTSVPINNGYAANDANFPSDAKPSDFDVIDNVQILKNNEQLTYKVLSNSNPGLVTPSLKDEYLTLNYAKGKTGTATIKVEAIDDFGATVTTTLTVNVTNTPVVTGATITPNSTTSATELTATPTSTDPFGDSVTYAYQWLQDGKTITGANSATLSLTGLAIKTGDTFSVQITPTDSAGNAGAAFTSNALTVSTVNPYTFELPAVTGVTIAPNSTTSATTLTATPVSTDPYSKTVTYTYQWLQNGAAISGATSATLTLSSATTTPAVGDTFSVEVTPSDGVTTGNLFTSQTVTLDTASPNTFDAPTATGVTIVPNSLTNTTSLTATDPTGTDSSYTGRTLTYTYQWDENGKAIASTVTSATTATLDLTKLTVQKGDTFSVVVTPSDGTISGTAFTSKAVTVATAKPVTLSVPTVTSVAIAPDSTTAATELTATPTSHDPYGQAVTYTYQWLENGTAISGATSQTLELSTVAPVSAGDTFSVQVTPSDSAVSGAVFTSKTVTVVTSSPVTFQLPVITSVTVTPNKASGTTTLTAKAISTDLDGRTVTYTYQWLEDGTDVAGATSKTLNISTLFLTSGEDFSVEVTPSDGTISGTAFTSGNVEIASTNPVVVGLPVVDGVTITPDNAADVAELTATPTSHDPSNSGGTISYTYQWLLNGKAISGATSATLDLATSVPKGVKAGNTLSVEVTPSDGTLTGGLFISKPVTIATTSPVTLVGPVVTSATISPDSLTNATKLTVTPSTNVSGTSVSYTYQWLLNGKVIAGATSATLTLTSLTIDEGDAISVEITPKNGSATGRTFISKALTVVTASPITFNLPTVTSVVITPDNASNTTTLTAKPASTDPYGNTVTYTYQWQDELAGATSPTAISGATGATLTLSSAGTISAGETFSVVVTPSDGLITGAPFTSGTVAIATTSPITLSGPVVTSVLISESATSLTATPQSTDPNGETVTYTYQWYDGNNAISGATGQNLDLSTLTTANVGDSLTVQVTPADATVAGATFTSGAVTVATTSPVTVNLPSVTSVLISPNNSTSTTTLTATPSGSDPYGDPVTYTYQWLHNGTDISGATGQTLTLSTAGTIAAADTFSVIVTPSDAIAVGAAFTSHTVTIATASPITLSGPTVNSVHISTNNASDTTTLTATPSSTDPSGQPVTYTYQWLQEGDAIAGATSQTLNLSTLSFIAGDIYTVEVTPSDPILTGAVFTSSGITVATTSPDVTFELPTVSSVAIVPNSATDATSLTADATAGTDPYGRTVTFTYQWLQNGIAIPATTGTGTSTGATSQTLLLSTLTVNANDVFTVEVTPNDGTVTGTTFTSGSVEATSASPTVAIGAPVVDSVSVQPNSASNVTTLTATPAASDPSGNSPITFSYQWLENGTAINGATSPTLNLTTQVSGGITVGETFSVQVTPNDGTLTGAAFTSTVVTIAGTNPITLSGPVVTSVVISADNDTNATMLTATPASTDSNNEAVTYTYQWLQDGTAISGATSQSLQLSGLTIIQGDSFTVQVTPADTTVTGMPFTSNAVTVSSINPVAINVPIVTAVAITPNSDTKATSLTAVPTGSDPYGRTLSYTYQWLQNGTPISSTTDSSATSQTLELSGLTVNQGDVFTVEVTPSDGTVAGTALTSGNVEATSVSPIEIGVPVVESVNISPNSLSDVTTLTASITSNDPSGNNTISYSYQWLLDGTAISGATSATLNLTAQVPGGVAAGEKFSVEVTPNDGTLTGGLYISNPVTIAQTSPITIEVPVVTSVAVTPNNATNATMLTANATSTDPYDSTVSYTYQWLENGQKITGATGQSLNLTGLNLSSGDGFSVVVTPNDGTVSGAAFTSGNVEITAVSPSIVIGLPVVESVSIQPDNALNVTTLTATPASSDPSGNNTITYTYQWLMNGAPITGAASATTATLVLSQVSGVAAGDQFSVQVTPNDGTLTGDLFTSTSVTIGTTSPITL